MSTNTQQVLQELRERASLVNGGKLPWRPVRPSSRAASVAYGNALEHWLDEIRDDGDLDSTLAEIYDAGLSAGVDAFQDALESAADRIYERGPDPETAESSGIGAESEVERAALNEAIGLGFTAAHGVFCEVHETANEAPRLPALHHEISRQQLSELLKDSEARGYHRPEIAVKATGRFALLPAFVTDERPTGRVDPFLSSSLCELDDHGRPGRPLGSIELSIAQGARILGWDALGEIMHDRAKFVRSLPSGDSE